MILARVMLIICVAATALSPRAASGQDPFKALELIKPARTRAANDFTVASTGREAGAPWRLTAARWSF